MEDRQSKNPGRVKITLDDGTVMFGTIERADEPTVAGTPLNKNTLFNSKNSERYVSQLPSEAFELLVKDITVRVPTNGWSASVNSDGYYTQAINVSGMKEKYTPVFSLEIGTAAEVDALQEAFALIPKAKTAENEITFFATEQPQVDLVIRLKGV